MENSKRYEMRGTKHHPIGSEMVKALHLAERQSVARVVVSQYTNEWVLTFTCIWESLKPCVCVLV